MKKQFAHGFTLLEMMITVGIIGIVVAIAAPSMKTLVNNQKMKTAAFDVVTTAMQARSEAIKWGSPSSGVPSISIVQSSGGMATGWCIVFTSDSTCNAANDTNPGPDVMLVNKATANVTYTSSAAPIGFGQTGRLLTGNTASGTAYATAPIRILIEDSDGFAAARCVVIDSTGNPKTYVQKDTSGGSPHFQFGGNPAILATCT